MKWPALFLLVKRLLDVLMMGCFLRPATLNQQSIIRPSGFFLFEFHCCLDPIHYYDNILFLFLLFSFVSHVYIHCLFCWCFLKLFLGLLIRQSTFPFHVLINVHAILLPSFLVSNCVCCVCYCSIVNDFWGFSISLLFSFPDVLVNESMVNFFFPFSGLCCLSCAGKAWWSEEACSQGHCVW